MPGKIVFTKSILYVLKVKGVQNVSAWLPFWIIDLSADSILRTLLNSISLLTLNTFTKNAHFCCWVVLCDYLSNLHDVTALCVLNDGGNSPSLRLLKVEERKTGLPKIVRLFLLRLR